MFFYVLYIYFSLNINFRIQLPVNIETFINPPNRFIWQNAFKYTYFYIVHILKFKNGMLLSLMILK